MNPNATFGIAITADDKTAKGFNSAEKRGEKTASKIGQSNKAWAKAAQDNIGGGSRGLIGNLGRVEKAATRAFSGMSGLGGGSGGIIGQLGAVRSMAGLAGEGLGSAAGEAGLFEAGLIGIGGAAVATGAVVVGLAAGMVKLSDSWGKGANNLGNMASLIGVSTEGLQKFAGAAERVGVDKNTAMGAMGGLSQSLNDARYGRNNAALSVLGRLGVKLQTNQDGTVNVEAMLPAIATALQGQNSSGRRTAARALGISDGALAAFTQGGKALSADMADFGENGAVVTDADTKLGRALTERDTRATQWMEKGMLAGQRANAGIVKGAGDAIIGAANGTSKIGMPSLIGSADAQTLPAAGGSDDAWGSPVGGGFGRRPSRRLHLSAQSIEDLKKATDTEWNHHSIAQGRGVVDTILNRTASGHWGRSVRSVVDARSQFSDINGRVAWNRGRHSVRDPGLTVRPETDHMVDEWLQDRANGAPSSIGDNLNYANPYTSDRKNLPWINELPMVRGSGRSIHRHGTTPENERYRPGEFGVDLPIRVVVEVHDKRSAATVTTHVGKGRQPAISHAMDSH